MYSDGSSVCVVEGMSSEHGSLCGLPVEVVCAALDSADAAIAIADRDAKILWTNRAFVELTGYEIRSLPDPSLRVLQAEEYPSAFADFWRATQAAIPWSGWVCHRRRDGTLYWTDHSITPMPGTDGTPQFIISVQRGVIGEIPLTGSVLDSLHTHICVLDPNGVIVQVNQAWRQFGAENGLGMPDAGVGTNYIAICNAAAGPGADMAQQIARGLYAVIRGEIPEFVLDYPCHAPDLERWFELRSYRLRAWPGAILLHEDITAHKHAENTRRAAEISLAAAQSRAKLGSWEMDPRTMAWSWSEEMFRLFGLDPSPSPPSWDVWLSLLHHEDRDSQRLFDDPSRLALLRGAPVGIEFRSDPARGAVRYFRAMLEVVPADGSGEFRIAATVQDITQERLAEEALRESEERWQFALEGAGDGTWEWKSDCGVSFSRQWKAMLGYAEAEVEDSEQAWRDLLHPDDREAAWNAVHEVFHGGSEFTQEYRMRGKDGRYKWILSRGKVAAPNAAGCAARIIGTHTDVTERKRIELELARMNRVYSAMVHVNEAIVRVRTREELFAEVTRALVTTGGFAMAWVGLDDPATHVVRPVASHGEHIEYLASVCVRTDLALEGLGPVGRAIRSGQLEVSNDFLHDVRMAPWRPSAELAGFCSSAALPFRVGGSVLGALCVYAKEADFFGKGEAVLLEQAAADISYGLEFLKESAGRRQAEEVLRENETRLRLALEAAALGTWDWDLVTGTITWDALHERIFGFAPGAFPGTYAAFEERIHSEDLPAVRNEIARAQSEQATLSIEFRIIRPDGAVRWITARGEFSYDASGNAVRMRGAVADITARMETEFQRAMLADTIDASRNEVYLFKEGTWKLLYANRGALDNLGFTFDEASQLFPLALIPGYTREELQAIAELLERGTEAVHLFEPMVRRADGTMYPAEVRLQLVDRGRERVFLAVATDITERKRAEAALQESEARFAKIFNTSFNAIAITSPATGLIIDVNDTWLRMLGYKREEVLGRTSVELGIWVDPTVRVDCVDGLIADGRISGVESVFRSRTGEIRVLIAGQFVEIQGERYMLWETRDITAQRQSEEEKEKLRQQLVEAQKMEAIGRLAGGVAHDFNNLLTVINGYSEQLLGKLPAEDPVRASIAEIHTAGERASSLVRQLLAFSRRQVLQRQSLDLNSVVKDMSTMISRLVGEDVETVLQLDPALDPVLADRPQLEQVVLNLAVNARDAMPNGGTLTIETGMTTIDTPRPAYGHDLKPGRYVRLTVRDTGVGMEDATRRQVFEPFFTTKAVGKGTGLGLSTVHGIVLQSEGQIEVESQIGHGSTFHIYMPPSVRPAVASASVAGPEPAAAQTARILLVEDQPDVRRYTASVLRYYGHQVLEASNGSDALAKYGGDGGIDLLVTDVMMPNINGPELVRRLRRLQPKLPVLFISGYASEMHGEQGRGLDGSDFLQKPFSPRGLAEKVSKLMRASKSARLGASIPVTQTQRPPL